MRRNRVPSAGIWPGCVFAALLAGCSSNEVLIAHAVNLERNQTPVAEDQLLDIAINVFNPGIPEGEIERELLEELIAEGTFVQIRRAESRYMAVQLKQTLDNTGHWGAIWVTPSPTTAADVNVTAEIVQSDGSIVSLRVHAVDATGRVWVSGRYEMETAAGAFNRARYGGLDPYQDVFNTIANDMSAAWSRLSASETRQVRQVAQLRFAGELSPDAFNGYVDQTRNGRYQLARLPAADDPMFDRSLRVRQREQLFMETLDQHYAAFSRDMRPSYDGWREYSREESIAIREVTRSARWRTGLGIATLVSAVVYGSNSSNNSFADRVIRDALFYVGTEVLRTGAMRRHEKRLHTMNLEELSGSFDDELRPMVVQIEGTQHRLEGAAEVQYQEWRDLMQRLFITETGFMPEDMEFFVEPEPELEERVPSMEEPAAVPSGEITSDAAASGVGGGA
jgi:hypothetical protein